MCCLLPLFYAPYYCEKERFIGSSSCIPESCETKYWLFFEIPETKLELKYKNVAKKLPTVGLPPDSHQNSKQQAFYLTVINSDGRRRTWKIKGCWSVDHAWRCVSFWMGVEIHFSVPFAARKLFPGILKVSWKSIIKTKLQPHICTLTQPQTLTQNTI